MLNIVDTINKAIEINRFKSDSELARAIGKNPAQINSYRKNKTLPSEDSMLRLAELAQENPDIALIDLAVLRSEGKVQEHWKKLRSTISAVAITLFILLSPAPSSASILTKNNMQNLCTHTIMQGDRLLIMRQSCVYIIETKYDYILLIFSSNMTHNRRYVKFTTNHL